MADLDQIHAVLCEIRDLLRHKPTQRANVTLEGFDRFWMLYPKKVGRGAAEQAWTKISPELHDQIMDAVQRQSRSEKWREDGGKYIPNPSTWLHQKRWMDQVKVTVAPVQLKAMQTVPRQEPGVPPPPEVAQALKRLTNGKWGEM